MSQTTVTIADVEEAAPAEKVLDISVISGGVHICINAVDSKREDSTVTNKANIMVPLDELTNALAFLAVSDRNDCLRPEVPFTKHHAKAFAQQLPMPQLSPWVLTDAIRAGDTLTPDKVAQARRDIEDATKTLDAMGVDV